ncbi:MAG: hypothetical protein IPN71_05930 [Fibrobacteres bacterium]|nr:hypothetical protein [Fibrobacterota bacterium]
MEARTSPRPPDQLNQWIEERIQLMEAPGHAFPQRFSKGDWLLVAAVATLCLAVIVAGAFL